MDAVLLLKTYHEVANPVELLRESASGAEARSEGWNHRSQREWRRTWRGKRGGDSRGESRLGYRLAEQYDFVKGDNMDYFLVFTAGE